jgi:hypothetical protein
MRRQYHDETHQQLVAFAAGHYTDRLAHLLRLAHRIDDRDRCLLVTHRQLVAETPAAFGALEQFLDLRAPLREDYQIMPTTGQAGIGDPSPNIRLGKIARSLPKKHVDLSSSLQIQLEQCYENCVEQLRQTIRSTGTLHLPLNRRAA